MSDAGCYKCGHPSGGMRQDSRVLAPPDMERGNNILTLSLSRDDAHLDILGGDDGGADGLVAHVAHVVVGLDPPGAESPLDRDTLPLMDWLLERKGA